LALIAHIVVNPTTILKGLLKKEEYKLSFKIYNGDIASLHGAMVGKQKVSQKVAYFRPSNSMALQNISQN
jgi:uncharacterized protein (DUF1015 family)